MPLNHSNQGKIIELINNDLINIINAKNDGLLYIFLVLIDKYGFSINYDYILEELLKTNRFNSIQKLCKLTYLNISIKANIEKIKSYTKHEKYINLLLKISQKFNEKYIMNKLTWDNFDSYLLILNNLKNNTKSFSYLINDIVKLLNFEQIEDTNILYLFYNLLDIPVKIILKFTIYNSNKLSSTLFKFNYDYCYDILETYQIQNPNILNKSHFHFFNDNVFNDAFNDKYLDDFQNKSIYHHMIDNEIYLRKIKKQRCR